MKNIRPLFTTLFFSICLVLTFSGEKRPLLAQDYSGRFGLGIELGEPTGFTGKYFFDKHVALNTGLTYSFQNFFLIYAEGLYHFYPSVFERNPVFQRISPYLGAGAGLRMTTDKKERHQVQGFLRIPLGLEWRPQEISIGVFAEIVPGMAFAPRVFALVQGGVGIRYYF